MKSVGVPPSARTGLDRVALTLLIVGVAGIVAGLGVWAFGSHGTRGLAILFGGTGFCALCFGNAAWGIILRSVRRRRKTSVAYATRSGSVPVRWVRATEDFG